MSYILKACAFLFVGFLLLGSIGCGGTKVDVSEPAQVTDEMERQAKAADNYFTDQSKTKKKSGN